MFAFLVLAVAMLIACALVMMRAGRRPVAASATDDSAEWAVMRAKRDEIETDPTLTPEAREQLRADWASQADAALAIKSPASPTAITSFAPWLMAALTLGVAVYALIGRWDHDALQSHAATGAVFGGHDQVPPREEAKHPGDNLSLEERIDALKTRLAAKPDDINGWVLLARSYGTQRNFKDGAAALEKALALAPGHPDLLADLADMLAMTQGKTLAGRPLELIKQALKAEPAHRKALALAATAAMEQKDKRDALAYWQRLRDTFPPDAPDLAQIDAAMQSLGAAPAASTPAANSPAASGGAIQGRVTASAPLIARLKQNGLPPEATLFVLAKVPGGMPMPVAVVRISAQALLSGGAIDFTLDDTTTMSPQFKLSEQKAVDVEARLSFSGTAARGPNDVSEKLTGVSVGAQGLRLVLK